MATPPPTNAVMTLPVWLGNGAVGEFLSTAGLRILPDRFLGPDEYRVEIQERSIRGRPNLINSRPLAGPPLDIADYTPLHAIESVVSRHLSDETIEAVARELVRVREFAEDGGSIGLIAPGLSLHQIQTSVVDPSGAAMAVKAITEDLLNHRFDDGDRVYPHAGAHLVRRDPALLRRFKIPAVLLRVARDKKLQQADLTDIKNASESGEVVFAASDGLASGIALLDAYLTPLLGALSPRVWAFSAARTSGTIVYTLGRTIPGVLGGAVEPLQLLSSREGPATATPPPLSPSASVAALTWWVRRLDKTLSIVSDPALFTDDAGHYVPRHHQHALLSIDQLFRRTGSIQVSHRDHDARRVLLFTVLDTLERLGNRTLKDMCTYDFAAQALQRVRSAMPSDAQEVLMPAAQRALDALEQLQDGFYLHRQTGSPTIDFTAMDGTTVSYTPPQAAAEYIRVLRNATHGHGSNRPEAVHRTDALLAHHDGTFPYDLPLLAYLYLLELLAQPEELRQALASASRV